MKNRTRVLAAVLACIGVAARALATDADSDVNLAAKLDACLTQDATIGRFEKRTAEGAELVIVGFYLSDACEGTVVIACRIEAQDWFPECIRVDRGELETSLGEVDPIDLEASESMTHRRTRNHNRRCK